MKKVKEMYEGMTVAELREETRRRGLPQQKGGKKLRKVELIEQLVSDDKNERKAKEKENKSNKGEGEKSVTAADVARAITLLQEKYCGSVKAACVNGFCVYVTYTEAKDGRVLKRATKGIVRKVLDEGIILVESKKGITCTLSVSSLLFYKDEDERKGYPDDIEEVFRMQEKEFRSYVERMKKCGEWKEK